MRNKMIKITVIIAFAGFMAAEAKACDICGCGVGSYYIGILPEFGKKIFGIRYRYNSLVTHIGAGGVQTYLTTQERYRTIDLWGGWNVGKKFRIMGYIPYSFNEKTNQGATTHKEGIGDIAVQGYYQLLDRKKTLGTKLLVQSLWVGGGVKLPTGKYEPNEKSSSLQEANIFQLGTRSVDFSLNAMYDLRIQDVGINATMSYKMNTGNKYDYQYGNKFSGSMQAYYKWRIKNKLTVAPNAGIMYENSAKDMDGKYEADISGGYALLATAGLETSFKKISVGANWQPALSQNLAGGFVKANSRVMVHVSFML